MWHLFFILLLLNFGISVVCLTQALVGEGLNHRNVSRKMSLVIGARRHLEWGHEKYILETINSHPALVSISVYSFFTDYYFLHKFISLWKSSTLFNKLCKVCSDDLMHIFKWSSQLFCLLSVIMPTLLLIFLYKTNFGTRAHTLSDQCISVCHFFTRCLVINSGITHSACEILLFLWVSIRHYLVLSSRIISIPLGWYHISEVKT